MPRRGASLSPQVLSDEQLLGGEGGPGRSRGSAPYGREVARYTPGSREATEQARIDTATRREEEERANEAARAAQPVVIEIAAAPPPSIEGAGAGEGDGTGSPGAPGDAGGLGAGDTGAPGEGPGTGDSAPGDAGDAAGDAGDGGGDFKKGGMVQGEGKERITAHAGEYVVNAAAVKKYGRDVLEAINRGRATLRKPKGR